MSFRPCLGVGRHTKPLQEYGILIQVLNSSSYYAQASGQAGSTNKIIKKILRNFIRAFPTGGSNTKYLAFDTLDTKNTPS